MNTQLQLILKEIQFTLESSDFTQSEDVLKAILNAKKIVVFGAGRVGFAMKSFGMRLNHLGLTSFFLGDVNVPATGVGDLMIVGSGSGNTISVADIVSIAQQNGLAIICVTANPNSVIAKSSASMIVINSPTKENRDKTGLSIQPMTTLFEQSLLIVLDSLVLQLMEKMNETNESMARRHNRLE
jgi:6-phospho-3-hexuloisomerase